MTGLDARPVFIPKSETRKMKIKNGVAQTPDRSRSLGISRKHALSFQI